MLMALGDNETLVLLIMLATGFLRSDLMVINFTIINVENMIEINERPQAFENIQSSIMVIEWPRLK